MTRPEDDFTSTVDGAAAFERHHGEEPYDDGPDQYDIDERDTRWIRPREDD